LGKAEKHMPYNLKTHNVNTGEYYFSEIFGGKVGENGEVN